MQERLNDRLGLFLMVLSGAFFALMAAFLKLLLPDTPHQSIVFTRSLAMTGALLIFARSRGVPLLGRRRYGWLLVRGFLGWAALSIYFRSSQVLPLGDAVLLQYSHPVFVALVAPLLLGEKTRGTHWLPMGMALVGVALVVGAHGMPLEGSKADLGDALISAGGGLLSGLAYMSVRHLSRVEHPITIMFWFCVIAAVLAAPPVIAGGSGAWPSGPREWLGHGAVAVTALLGQWFLTQGLSRAAAARATAASLGGPVFGIVFDRLFFGKLPAGQSLLGAILVIGGIVLLARPTVARRRAVPVQETSEPSREDRRDATSSQSR